LVGEPRIHQRLLHHSIWILEELLLILKSLLPGRFEHNVLLLRLLPSLHGLSGLRAAVVSRKWLKQRIPLEHSTNTVFPIRWCDWSVVPYILHIILPFVTRAKDVLLSVNKPRALSGCQPETSPHDRRAKQCSAHC